MIDNRLTRLLWLGTALTLPIFGVSFGHIDLGPFHFAPPVICMLGVFYVTLIILFVQGGISRKQLFPHSYKTLGWLLSLFLVLHLFSLIHSNLIQSEWIDIFGIKNVIKILTDYLLFWITIALFPRNEKFIGRFFLIAVFSLSILLAVFIYRYAVVFHVPFLGTDYPAASRSGKNQMAVQVVFFFFYTLCYFFFLKRKLLVFPVLLIISISIIYLGSRMGWGATVFGVLYIISYVWRKNRALGFKLAAKILLAFSLITTLGVAAVSRYTNLEEISIRALSIFDPSAIPDEEAPLGKHSYELRGRAIRQAFDGFMQSPIIGVGVGNTLDYVERITHNDYMTVLLELGLPGEMLFLAILYTIWQRAKPQTRVDKTPTHWLSLATRSGFLTLIICLNFFNLYLSPYFWFYMALFIVTVETIEKPKLVDNKVV